MDPDPLPPLPDPSSHWMEHYHPPTPAFKPLKPLPDIVPYNTKWKSENPNPKTRDGWLAKLKSVLGKEQNYGYGGYGGYGLGMGGMYPGMGMGMGMGGMGGGDQGNNNWMGAGAGGPNNAMQQQNRGFAGRQQQQGGNAPYGQQQQQRRHGQAPGMMGNGRYQNQQQQPGMSPNAGGLRTPTTGLPTRPSPGSEQQRGASQDRQSRAGSIGGGGDAYKRERSPDRRGSNSGGGGGGGRYEERALR